MGTVAVGMSPQINPAQVQTAENMLAGDKHYESVRFALTGVPTADVISGIHAVLGSVAAVTLGLRNLQRIFEMLAAHYKDSADNNERVEASLRQMQQYQPAYPTQTPAPSIFPNYTSGAGMMAAETPPTSPPPSGIKSLLGNLFTGGA